MEGITTLSARKQRRWIAVLVGVCIAALAVMCVGWKYQSLLYNAIDLGIFRQVIDNTADGRLFAASIHPPSYFGDHSSPFLLLLAPVYRLLPFGETLLVLQILAVLLGAWPLALLTRSLPPYPRIAILCAYFVFPLVHTIVLFEFELLVFSVPLLLAAILAYEQRRLGWFFACCLLCATIREDVGLVILGFSVLSFFERRPLVWGIPPMAIGLGALAAGFLLPQIIHGEQYKFFVYYAWAGTSFGDAARFILTHPWVALLKLFRLQNILSACAALLLTAGFPLLRPRTLVPVTLTAAAFFLTSFGGDWIAFRTHYAAAFLPFLFWGIVRGIERLTANPPRWILRCAGPSSVSVASSLLLVVSLYGFATFSPIGPRGLLALSSDARDQRAVAARAIVRMIPDSASVAAGYRFLPHLAAREHLASLGYVFHGKQQFTEREYPLPEDTSWIVYDASDYLFYQAQYDREDGGFDSGDDRLRNALASRGFSLRTIADSFLVYERGGKNEEPSLVEFGNMTGRSLPRSGGRISLVAIGGQKENLYTSPWAVDPSVRVLPISLTWILSETPTTPYILRVSYVNAKGEAQASRYYPLGYGILPATEWPTETPVTTRFWWIPPTLPEGNYHLRVHVVTLKGYLTLDPKLTAVFQPTETHQEGGEVEIGSFSVGSVAATL
jgi:uncharacterized membrane protein